MSKILRRPMFRGGPVSSYNTGITSGLGEEGYADGGRVGFQKGGGYFTDTPFGRVLSDVGLAGRGILSDLYNVAGVPTNIATEFLTGYNPGFSGERIFGLEGKRDPLRFSTFEPGKSKFFGFNTSSVPGRTYTEDMYKDATQRGLDITREKPFEISDEAYQKPTTSVTSKNLGEVKSKLPTEEDDIKKQAELYQKLLGGDEAKKQAIYDALLAASPAFFKGKNLREAAPEVLTAINKSGAFDKPRDIKQAAAQLAIQRQMMKDKATAEERSRLEYLRLQQGFREPSISDKLIKAGVFENFRGDLPSDVKKAVPEKYYVDEKGRLIKVVQDPKTKQVELIVIPD